MKNYKNIHEYYMKLALALAEKGMGWTLPNPMVGAVIVKNGNIIGQGYHRKFGKAHAEIDALKSLKASAKGARLYVTLEPCCHFGKTPPCTNAIIRAGFKQVVCSSLDPNPKVCGKGVKVLRQAGVAVNVGIMRKEARALNQAFFTFHEKQRPFVALKFAASLDGKIATRSLNSKWITSETARKFARDLRGRHQAVLVGANTVIRDNPHLGARVKNLPDPLRIVLDSSLRVPLSLRIFRDLNVLVVTTEKATGKKINILQRRGVDILKFPGKKILLKSLIRKLFLRNIVSILVEGGGKVLGSFADQKIADKVYAFHAPLLIGGRGAISAIEGRGADKVQNALRLENVKHYQFGEDILTEGEIKARL